MTKRYFWLALLFNVLLLSLRIYEISLERYALYGDEAQYWTWAKALDWGYYSKPPVVAWLIAATTALFGDSSFAIRLSSPLLHFGTALIVYGIAVRLYSERTAFWASITFASLPAVTLSSTLISTDPALLFFWALSLYGLVRAESENALKWWIFTGIAAGFGALSKYSMLFFGASALLYFYWQGTAKQQLRNPKLWAGVVATIAIYLPNLWWNAQHNFVSYLHTGDNAEGDGFGFFPGELFEFIAAQLAVFGPLLLGVLCLLLWRAARRRPEGKTALAVAFIAPMLSVILVISLLSRAHANWAAPIYIAATLVVVNWLLERGLKWLLVISLLLHMGAACIFYHFDQSAKLAGIELTRKNDPFRRLKGGIELADAAAARMKLYPHAKIVSEERRVVANLMYYLGEQTRAHGHTYRQPTIIYKWNAEGRIRDHYDLMTNMNAVKGADFLMITRTDSPKKFAPYFRSIETLKPITIPLYRDYSLKYVVYLLKGFKGY